jgi:N-acetylmuramoyl-L-alanine amidase
MAALAILFLVWPARRLQSANFVFYLPNERRLIPVWTFGTASYLPVIPVLEMSGLAATTIQKGNSLQVWFGGTRLRLRLNQTKVQIGRLNVKLQEPIIRVNGQWLAPIDFLSSVLPLLSGQPVVYRAGDHRAFLGGVQPITFGVQLQSLPSGAQLVVNFTGRVTIQTAATNGQWVIFLGAAAVQPLEQNFFFRNPYLTELRFDDQDGRPKLIVTPGQQGLDFYPRLTGNGEQLVAAVLSPAGSRQAASAKQAAPPGTLPRGGGTTAPSAAASSAPVAPLPVVVLDAGHGGADAGARSRDGILEKNLTAQLASLTAAALGTTKHYRVVFTRPGDSDPDFEQRAVTANTARPIVFLTFHAGELGDRTPMIVVYTYQAPSPPSPPETATPVSLFTPWNWAQGAEQARSQALAQDLQTQFAQIPGIVAAQRFQAPVRQLRSVAAPAVAIEVGTLTPGDDAGALNQAGFQQQVASAVAKAVEQFSSTVKS